MTTPSVRCACMGRGDEPRRPDLSRQSRLRAAVREGRCRCSLMAQSRLPEISQAIEPIQRGARLTGVAFANDGEAIASTRLEIRGLLGRDGICRRLWLSRRRSLGLLLADAADRLQELRRCGAEAADQYR